MFCKVEPTEGDSRSAMKTLDAIVIGLGGMGSAAAYHLSSRGATVLGLDSHHAAHDLGSSHGGSRIFRQAYHEGSRYVPLVLRASELWRKLEADSGEHIMEVTGGLLVGAPESDIILGSLLSAKMHRLAHQLLTANELADRFPNFKLTQNEVAVHELNAGFVRPERAVSAFLRVAAEMGAELHFNEPVAAWEIVDSGEVRVTTYAGVYEAARLILAPGAWVPDLICGLNLPIHVRRHVMAWFEPITDIESFMPAHFPVYVWQSSSDRTFYGFPAIDGRNGGVKVAMHSGGDLCTPQTIDRAISGKDERELREELAAHIPSLNGLLLRAETCMYTLTADEHFIVGLHPHYPQVSIACGFSGHGFKFASVIGEILADLVLRGKTSHDIEFLSPLRFRM
jgi:sarcosine oxidase